MCVYTHTHTHTHTHIYKFSLVTQVCPTLCDPMDCSTLGFPVHHQLPEFTQTRVHWVGDAIQPPHPLSSPSLPTFNLSQHQGLFQWNFSFSISPSNEYSGLISFFFSEFFFFFLISFRMNRLDLLAAQETLKSLLQHIYKMASVLSHSLWPCGLQSARLLCPWILQETVLEWVICPPPGGDPCLGHLWITRWFLYHWCSLRSHGSHLKPN